MLFFHNDIILYLKTKICMIPFVVVVEELVQHKVGESKYRDREI